MGTTHNVGSSLRVQLVTLPDQRLTRPCLAECVLAIALGSAVSGVDSSVKVQCVVAFKTYSVKLLSSETLVCVLAVTYGDSSTTSQAEVPLERIHAFYWEMGPFTKKMCTEYRACLHATSFLQRHFCSVTFTTSFLQRHFCNVIF